MRSLWFAIGNLSLTLATDVLFRGRIRDMETCYKVLPADLWRALQLKGNRFDIEPEITAKVLRLRKRIVNVPITYSPRSNGEGKKIGVADGRQALATLVRLRLQSRRTLFTELQAAPEPSKHIR